MNIAQKIHNFIEENKDNGKAEFSRKLITTALPIYGVPIPVLNRFASELAKEEFPFKALPLDSHEAVCIAGFYLAKAKIPQEEKLAYFDALSNHFDNWATVDCCTSKMKVENDDYFIGLLSSPSPFKKRTGIIYLMSKLKRDPQKYLTLILSAKDDNYYVKMAQAWAISQACIFDFDFCFKTISSLEDEFIKRKAISKCCDSFRLSQSQKSLLKSLRNN